MPKKYTFIYENVEISTKDLLEILKVPTPTLYKFLKSISIDESGKLVEMKYKSYRHQFKVFKK